MAEETLSERVERLRKREDFTDRMVDVLYERGDLGEVLDDMEKTDVDHRVDRHYHRIGHD